MFYCAKPKLCVTFTGLYFTEATKAIAPMTPGHCLGAHTKCSSRNVQYSFLIGCPLPRRKCLGALLTFKQRSIQAFVSWVNHGQMTTVSTTL